MNRTCLWIIKGSIQWNEVFGRCGAAWTNFGSKNRMYFWFIHWEPSLFVWIGVLLRVPMERRMGHREWLQSPRLPSRERRQCQWYIFGVEHSPDPIFGLLVQEETHARLDPLPPWYWWSQRYGLPRLLEVLGWRKKDTEKSKTCNRVFLNVHQCYCKDALLELDAESVVNADAPRK